MRTQLNIFFTLLLALISVYHGYAQEIILDRVLIGSGYSEYDNGSDFTLSASVGEAAIRTKSTTNLIITEGFQQSNYILSDPLIVDLLSDSAACIGANDGAVAILYLSPQIKAPLVYQWSNGASTAAITNLEVGKYTVTITGSNGKSVTNSVWVSAIDSVDCLPHFYTGITPNGDNFNDYWHIDNTEFFAKKEIKVFNRYGAKLWSSDNYDNVSDFFSGLHENGEPLPDGTYYYIAKFDNSTYRGWIEVSR